MSDLRLFAHGEAFDADAFLESTTLRPDRVWRRGDQRRYSCVASHHPTSGVEFVLGDGLIVPLLEQERLAVSYLKSHRDELRALARLPGIDTFILCLQYRTAFGSNVSEFCLSPSARLMWHCLDVGCRPTYYVALARLSESEEESEPDAADM
jgi:hypothetical protein